MRSSKIAFFNQIIFAPPAVRNVAEIRDKETAKDANDAKGYGIWAADGSTRGFVASIPLCSSFAPADFDHDCDVDAAEFTARDTCYSGPQVPRAAGCETKDLDNDGDVDQADFGLFLRCYSGSGNPADPNCEN